MPAQRDISSDELMLPKPATEVLATKPGAMLLNAWNSEKIIAFF